MSSEQLEITYVDLEKKQLASLKGEDFVNQLNKLKSAIEHVVKYLQTFGEYELSEFTAKAGIELGAVIFKADGAIEMKWTKPKKS